MNFRYISSWCIRNPVFPIVVFVGLMLAGFIAFAQMQVNNAPDIDFPAAVVSVSQPGAAPNELETQITQRVESAIRGVNGVDEMSSTVVEGNRKTLLLASFGPEDHQLLMQGGHHPDLGVDYYEDLFSSIKARYKIHLHALSPPEVQHIARRSKLTIPQTLTRLRDAGLDSLPGGGGEILVDRVRNIISPKKTNSSEWLGVMRDAHRLGVSSTATMMYGHVETVADRVEHMRRIRELQDATGGFRAFISWTFQDDGNRLGALVPHETMPTSFDYLLTQAVSRIYLDNVPHIQSSWVTQGMKIGQVALGFGADDMGSVMMEENVVSAAGTTHRTSVEELVHLIRSLGKTPVQRDTLYREVKIF